MTHYYFDLKNGTTERDHAGLDLDSDTAAIRRAYVIADEAGMRPMAHEHHERHVCIIHEDGHEVTRVLVPVMAPAEPVSASRFKKFS